MHEQVNTLNIGFHRSWYYPQLKISLMPELGECTSAAVDTLLINIDHLERCCPESSKKQKCKKNLTVFQCSCVLEVAEGEKHGAKPPSRTFLTSCFWQNVNKNLIESPDFHPEIQITFSAEQQRDAAGAEFKSKNTEKTMSLVSVKPETDWADKPRCMKSKALKMSC